MATIDESNNSPLPSQSIDEIKLPSLTVLNETKTCSKCEHITKTGIDIYSTLAYSRCRCHRDWKYENESHQIKWQQNEMSGDGPTHRMPRIRYPGNTITTGKRCLSAMVRQSTQNGVGIQQPDKPVIIMEHPRKMIKLRYISSQKTTDKESCNSTSSDTMSPSSIPNINITTSSVPKLPQCNSSVNSITSSVTKLPSIVSNRVSPSNISRKQSPLQPINTSMCPIIRKPTQTKKVKKQQHFEFTHLLEYISPSMKQKALEMFKRLDIDGDGHLSYSEVLNGLNGDMLDTKAIVDSYLKPIYHLLGDATYFGKRDFVLCYNIVKLLREHKLPKIPRSQSKEFYEKTMKPLMSLMYLSATEEGTISIFVIEDLVKQFSRTTDTKIVFRKYKVTNQIEEDGLLSLVNTFILAPFLFEI